MSSSRQINAVSKTFTSVYLFIVFLFSGTIYMYPLLINTTFAPETWSLKC